MHRKEAMWISSLQRGLRWQPAGALLIILALGLGIASVTVVFALLDTLLLRPLPYPNASRVDAIWTVERRKPADFSLSSPALYADLARSLAAYSTIGAYYFENINLVAVPSGPLESPERLASLRILPGFFETLGVQPALGRFPTSDEYRSGTNRTVVVTWSFYSQRLNANPRALNQTMDLSGSRFQIVGVLPPDFRFPSRSVALFAPAQLVDDLYQARPARFLRILGLRAPNIEATAAAASLRLFADQLGRQHPREEKDFSLETESLRRFLVGAPVEQSLFLLALAVSLLLLIALINAANLMFTRSLSRLRQQALQLAIGCSRSRLFCESLGESILLSLTGGLAGCLLSVWVLDLIRLYWRSLPSFLDVQLDWRIAAAVAFLSALAGLLAGLLPAWQASRRDILTTLRRTSSSSSLGGRQRGARLLVAAEVALSLLLLTGAFHLGGQLAALDAASPGFRSPSLLTFQITLPWETPFAEQLAFFRNLRLQFAASPAVSRVAYASKMPFDSEPVTGFRSDAAPGRHAVDLTRVSPHYFDVLSLPVLAGRAIAESDSPGKPRVVVLNRAAAQLFFPDRNPIGQTIYSPWNNSELKAEVIGVVADLPSPNDKPAIYQAFQDSNWPSPSFFVSPRGTASQQSTLADLRQRLRQFRPQQAIHTIRSMEQYLLDETAEPRTSFWLVAAFSVIAALLTGLGVLGVLLWFLNRHRAELGLRLALGARPHRLVLHLARHGLGSVAAGLLAGALLSLLLPAGIFPAMSPTLTSLTLAASLLGLLSLLAMLYPALRALRISPVESLRPD